MKAVAIGTTLATLFMGVCLLWQARELSSLRAKASAAQAKQTQPAQEPSDAAPETQAELERLRAAEAAKTREIARLRGQLGAMLRGRSNSIQATTSVDAAAATQASAGAADWLKHSTDRYVESQIVRARERLNLTPEQEGNVRIVVSNAMHVGGENLRKVLSGQARVEDVPSQAEWAKALEAQVLATLTKEQQVAYHTHKREDVSANARLIANGELLSLQNRLDLNLEQQDQVFAVLYDQAVQQLDPDAAALAATPRQPAHAAELKARQKTDALRGVLTARQLQTFEEIQQSGVSTVRAFFPERKP